jgi:hypothetical protein
LHALRGKRRNSPGGVKGHAGSPVAKDRRKIEKKKRRDLEKQQRSAAAAIATVLAEPGRFIATAG